MIKAIKVGAVVEYTSRHDKSEPKTVWLLRIAPLGWRVEVWGSIAPVGMRFEEKDVIIKVVKMGLAGWRGFVDENGNEIQPEYEKDKKYGLQVLTDDVLGKIPWLVLDELAFEIYRLNFLGEPQKKG